MWIVGIVILVAAAVGIAVNLPDIRRYVRLRKM